MPQYQLILWTDGHGGILGVDLKNLRSNDTCALIDTPAVFYGKLKKHSQDLSELEYHAMLAGAHMFKQIYRRIYIKS